MKTVYVGLSGGVDSSVSAALLLEQGYNVVGVYMKNWTADVAGVECPWRADLADARAAAAVLDIPFKVFDFQAEYKQNVVDVMVAEYQAGRTPNPDVMCNQHIKFDLFLKTALADGADLIATGHYARVVRSRKDLNTEKRYIAGGEVNIERRYLGDQLLIPHDRNKDQTYFLYRITGEALSKVIFPLEGMTKPEVRELAEKFGLPTAKKPDSQGICFVGEVGIREFLRQYVDATPGPVLHHATGRRLGEHQGAVFYTTGQRHGLGIGGGSPYYVVGKDVAANTVYVTDNPADLELEAAEFSLEQTHWINEAPEPGRTYAVRARYRAGLIPGTLEPTAAGGYRVKLERPERAVTPGQSAVIYDGDRVLGGGLIAG